MNGTPAQPGFPGGRRHQVPADPANWIGPVDDTKTLPLVVRARADIDLAGWAQAHAHVVEGWLDQFGAVLFAGFDVDREGFGAVATALAGSPQPYRERSSPRTELAPGVYTSTEHPADQAIPLHNENSYQRTFPARLAFCCLDEPDEGGGTPLADCRAVLRRLPTNVVATFRRKNVRYVRNYGGGAGLPWQEALGPDRAAVERYCSEEGLAVEWLPGDRLRTRAVRPALTVHPRTGQEVWFNHAGFFHISALGPDLSRALLEEYGEAGLPVNAYYGDGEPIEPAVLELVRDAYAAETRCRRWRRGDVLLLDNLLVAHGREPFRGPRQVVVSLGPALARPEPARP